MQNFIHIKYIKCCFQNFVNVREDHNERIDRLLLVLKMKKKFNCSYYTVLLMLVNYFKNIKKYSPYFIFYFL